MLGFIKLFVLLLLSQIRGENFTRPRAAVIISPTSAYTFLYKIKFITLVFFFYLLTAGNDIASSHEIGNWWQFNDSRTMGGAWETDYKISMSTQILSELNKTVGKVYICTSKITTFGMSSSLSF